MHRQINILVLLATLALPLACDSQGGPKAAATSTGGGGGSCAQPPKVGDYPCDVFAVIQTKCARCHRDPPLESAPFSLLTYEDTQAKYGLTDRRYWQRMEEVIQPNGSPHMPKTPPELTKAEFETLDGWFKACAPPAPEGQGCECPGKGCTGGGGGAGGSTSP